MQGGYSIKAKQTVFKNKNKKRENPFNYEL